MARRRLETYEDYDRALRQGFGVGEREAYTPWLRVQDVPSDGQSSKIPGIKIDREHHVLSNNEKRIFFFIERKKIVLDIREQFPVLPLDLTVRLAEELGIKHPLTRKGKVPEVRSIDFVLTLTARDYETYAAVSVKEASELTNPRTLELLELERATCQVLGIPWRLVTDKQINNAVAANLDWASEPLRGRLKRKYAKENLESELLDAVLELVCRGVISLSLLIPTISRELDIGEKIAEDAIKVLIWEGRLVVDLTQMIQRTRMIDVQSVSKGIETVNHAAAG